MSTQVRVLVVDDSPIMQKLLTNMLASDARLLVVGLAANGEECIQKTIQLKPSVILLDLEMPILDGLETIRELSQKNLEVAVLMICEFAQKESDKLKKCIESGAFDFFVKPKSTLEIDKYQRQVITKIFVASFTRTKQLPKAGPKAGSPEAGGPVAGAGPVVRSRKYTLVGCNTGSKLDLSQFIPALGSHVETAIIILMQQPAFVAQQFIKEMKATSRLPMVLVEDGTVIQPKTIYVAPAGAKDLLVEKAGTSFVLKMAEAQEQAVNHPSMDRFMESGAQVMGADTCGVILSGTGKDGLMGMRAIKDAKGLCLALDKTTAAVNQLPSAVANAQLAHEVLPIKTLAERISHPVS